MKVLILGGNGMLGPWVVRSLKNFHDILLTDINDPPKSYKGDYQKLSVDDTAKESQIDMKIVEKIYSMYKNSEHKRITPKAF